MILGREMKYFFKTGLYDKILSGILFCLVGLLSAPSHSATRIFVSDVGGVRKFDEAGNFLGFFGETAGRNPRGMVLHVVDASDNNRLFYGFDETGN